MTRRAFLAATLAFAAAVVAFAQRAEPVPPIDGPRHALVIGNAAYAEFGRLKNPVNDAADMAAALRRIGFSVELLTDADLAAMEAAAVRLSEALRGDRRSIGLFYYAGHGVQSAGENYLIPVRASIASESLLKHKALSAQAVLDLLGETGNRLNIIILDACRDFPSSWSRGSTRGLTVVSRQPPGSVILFATSAGDVARDGDGRNGVFTSQLLRFIESPELDLNALIDRTAESVLSTTGNAQHPAVYKQFFGSAYLNPAGARAAAERSGESLPKAGETAGGMAAHGPRPADAVTLARLTIPRDSRSAEAAWERVAPTWVKNPSWNIAPGSRDFDFDRARICRDAEKLYWRVEFPDVNPFKKTPKGVSTMLCIELTFYDVGSTGDAIILKVNNHKAIGEIDAEFGTFNDKDGWKRLSSSAITHSVREKAVEGSIRLSTLRKTLPLGTYKTVMQMYILGKDYIYTGPLLQSNTVMLDLSEP